jgi:hypothetical protein
MVTYSNPGFNVVSVKEKNLDGPGKAPRVAYTQIARRIVDVLFGLAMTIRLLWLAGNELIQALNRAEILETAALVALWLTIRRALASSGKISCVSVSTGDSGTQSGTHAGID